MKFTINRDTWLRGEGALYSRLYRPEDGKMCCLGQIAHDSFGVSLDDIENVDAPASLVYRKIQPDYLELFTGGYLQHSPFGEQAMSINDDRCFTDSMREEKLIDLFRFYGHELEFVGGNDDEED